MAPSPASTPRYPYPLTPRSSPVTFSFAELHYQSHIYTPTHPTCIYVTLIIIIIIILLWLQHQYYSVYIYHLLLTHARAAHYYTYMLCIVITLILLLRLWMRDGTTVSSVGLNEVTGDLALISCWSRTEWAFRTEWPFRV